MRRMPITSFLLGVAQLAAAIICVPSVVAGEVQYFPLHIPAEGLGTDNELSTNAWIKLQYESLSEGSDHDSGTHIEERTFVNSVISYAVANNLGGYEGLLCEESASKKIDETDIFWDSIRMNYSSMPGSIAGYFSFASERHYIVSGGKYGNYPFPILARGDGGVCHNPKALLEYRNMCLYTLLGKYAVPGEVALPMNQYVEISWHAAPNKQAIDIVLPVQTDRNKVHEVCASVCSNLSHISRVLVDYSKGRIDKASAEVLIKQVVSPDSYTDVFMPMLNGESRQFSENITENTSRHLGRYIELLSDGAISESAIVYDCSPAIIIVLVCNGRAMRVREEFVPTLPGEYKRSLANMWSGSCILLMGIRYQDHLFLSGMTGMILPDLLRSNEFTQVSDQRARDSARR